MISKRSVEILQVVYSTDLNTVSTLEQIREALVEDLSEVDIMDKDQINEIRLLIEEVDDQIIIIQQGEGS